VNLRRKGLGQIKYLVSIYFIFATIAFFTPIVFAEGIGLDGVVDEGEWIWWFKDIESTHPYADVYWYADTENLYLGIVTDDANENQDLFQFAFRTIDLDYWIQVKPGVGTKYRKSGGDWEHWWTKSYSGLPKGVDIVADDTGGNRSYEISISLSLWGKNVDNLPDNFRFWYMIQDGTPDGSRNFYPNDRSGWWFQVEIELDRENHIPVFSVPELPFGSVLALISMITALMIFFKRPVLIKT
jgi:hypothetical protein